MGAKVAKRPLIGRGEPHKASVSPRGPRMRAARRLELLVFLKIVFLIIGNIF